MTNDPKFIPGTAIRKESKPPAGDPWADDVLGSKKIAEKLTNAVEDAAKVNVNNAYVIGLHGEWGTGKTFLLERWCEELKLKENSPRVAIYYNAWEDDFLANPLVAIVAGLQGAMSKIEKLRSMARRIMPIAKVVSKVARGHIGVDIVAIMSKMAKGIKEHKDVDEVERYRDLRKETDVLKRRLGRIARVARGKTNFPLVFVIDELDRCRPVFALEVLERVKHLFNVPGVVFVLGMNKAGLQKSIEKIYGYDDAQSEKYLRRFFDKEVSMPFSSPEVYCYHLLNANNVTNYSNDPSSFIGRGIVDDFFLPMTGFLGLSLREVESLVRLLLDVINKKNRIGGARRGEARLVLCLMFLKVKTPALYSRVIEGEISCNNLIDEMMEMFCDEKNVNPRFPYEFRLCQDTVEEEIYRLAGAKEWKDMIKQMEILQQSEKPYSDYSTLAKRTMELGKDRVILLYNLYTENSVRELSRVSVKDITSLIELNDVK